MTVKQENNNLLFLATLWHLFQQKTISAKDTYNFYAAFMEKINKSPLSRRQVGSLVSRLDKNVCVQKIICKNPREFITLEPNSFANLVALYSNDQEINSTNSDLQKFLRILCMEAKSAEKNKYSAIYSYWEQHKAILEEISRDNNAPIALPPPQSLSIIDNSLTAELTSLDKDPLEGCSSIELNRNQLHQVSSCLSEDEDILESISLNDNDPIALLPVCDRHIGNKDAWSHR